MPDSALVSSKWHPKLTPYRLLVLGATTGVGTAKTLAILKGQNDASTTLEWISGVLVFLILHFMSTYDELPKDPPPMLRWLFCVDCMDFVWRALSYMSLRRPLYASDPLPSQSLGKESRTSERVTETPVTLYRLLVCFCISFFGLTKAVLAYYGNTDGATWVDWTLGVAITTILYIIGLYENNPIGIWHGFFVHDYSNATQYAFTIIGLTTVLTLWIVGCLWIIQISYTSDVSAFLSSEDNPVSIRALTRLARTRERLFAACFALFMALVVVLTLVGGFLAISSITHDSKVQFPLSSWWKRPTAKDKSYFYEPGHERRRLINRILIHTISHTAFLLGCSVFLAFWLASIAANAEEAYYLYTQSLGVGDATIPTYYAQIGAVPPSNVPAQLVRLACAITSQVLGAAACAFLMWLVARTMALPALWRYRAGDVSWDMYLLY